LVCGILSILLFWLTFFDLVPIVLGFIFSAQGIGEARRRGMSTTLAKTGLWLTAVGTAFALIFTVTAVVLYERTDCSVAHSRGSIQQRICSSRNDG